MQDRGHSVQVVCAWAAQRSCKGGEMGKERLQGEARQTIQPMHPPTHSDAATELHAERMRPLSYYLLGFMGSYETQAHTIAVHWLRS